MNTRRLTYLLMIMAFALVAAQPAQADRLTREELTAISTVAAIDAGWDRDEQLMVELRELQERVLLTEHRAITFDTNPNPMDHAVLIALRTTLGTLIEELHELEARVKLLEGESP